MFSLLPPNYLTVVVVGHWWSLLLFATKAADVGRSLIQVRVNGGIKRNYVLRVVGKNEFPAAGAAATTLNADATKPNADATTPNADAPILDDNVIDVDENPLDPIEDTAKPEETERVREAPFKGFGLNWSALLSLQVSESPFSSLLFVRDGIHSVADYNSTRMGVGVVVVVVVVVYFFTMG